MAAPPKLTPETWQEVLSKRASGATYNALAKEYGVTRPAISKRARQSGLPTCRQPAPNGQKPKDGAGNDLVITITTGTGTVVITTNADAVVTMVRRPRQ